MIFFNPIYFCQVYGLAGVNGALVQLLVALDFSIGRDAACRLTIHSLMPRTALAPTQCNRSVTKEHVQVILSRAAKVKVIPTRKTMKGNKEGEL